MDTIWVLYAEHPDPQAGPRIGLFATREKAQEWVADLPGWQWVVHPVAVDPSLRFIEATP